MQQFKLDEKIIECYENFKKAYLKLKEFVDTDNKTEKDRAAIIQAYGYTFEQWWRVLQRYLQYNEMVTEFGPRDTIQTAFQHNIIDHGSIYMSMLKNRNLITHTYKEDVAQEIYTAIKEEYMEELENFIRNFDNKILKNEYKK